MFQLEKEAPYLVLYEVIKRSVHCVYKGWNATVLIRQKTDHTCHIKYKAVGCLRYNNIYH